MEKLPKFKAGKLPSIAQEDVAELVRKAIDALINAESVSPIGEFDTTGDKFLHDLKSERVPLVKDSACGWYDVAAIPSEKAGDEASAKTAIKTALGITPSTSVLARIIRVSGSSMIASTEYVTIAEPPSE